MTNPTTGVTVIGLGRMGAALAEVFVRNANPTTVWNRTAAKAEPLVAQGAGRAATVTEAISASPITFVVLPDDTVVTDTLAVAASALDGRTIVNLTTGRPDEARALSAWVSEHGGHYLDGGILGVPQSIGTAESVTIYSGSTQAQGEFGSLLEALGTVKYLGADPGSASLNDMAILSGMYGMFAGYFQAVAMVSGEEITAAEFTDSLLVPWLRALLEALPMLAGEIDSGEYPVTFSDLAANHSGLANILRTSRDQGSGDALLAPLMELFERQSAKGHGKASFSRVVEELKPA